MRSATDPTNGQRRRAARGCLLGGAALALLVLALALPSLAAATPARYVFEMCDSALPGGGVSGVRHSQSGGEPWSQFDNCDQPGGSLETSLSAAIGTGGSATWSLPIEPPPGGRMESTSISAASCMSAGTGGMSAGTDGYILGPGWPFPRCTEEVRVFQLPENFRSFDIELACGENCAAGAWIYAHYFATVEVDPVPPTLSELSGSLLDGAIQRGHQSVAATAHDVGGGISKLSVLVNGLPAAPPKAQSCAVAQAQNPSVTGTVATQIIPCPTTATASWELDTGAYPFSGGANTVQVCASDFATLGEPNTTCSAPQTVEVDDSCAESPVPGGEVLSAQFKSTHGEAITVPFDHSAEVVGELANNAGDAISGATICVQAQTLGSQRGLTPVATATTDADGHFSYKVPPGPNRKVLLGYRHDAFQVARSVNYYAHSKPTLGLSSSKVKSGSAIRISGKVPGPRAAGRVVVLQASALHSRRWFTFHRATANDHGVFHSRYRFDATTRTTTYRIRAVIPRQRGYPWEVGHSKPAPVEVRVG